ncbi:hypothetical protein OG896_29875 [Streptomyces sp. NBC_00669]|uniref:hypothetical protein n=1 Tax=Streptomyces sp. NBC_00669 TaxID=2976011 RepID=UPI002E2FA709|nr:hypothetical protein [Streptomyces sp. NBC_00669]
MAVDLSFFRSETSEKLRDEGRAEGRVESGRESLLLLLTTRGLLDDAIRSRVTACGDPDLLRAWFRRALTAGTAEQIFTGGDEPTG